MDLWGWDGYGMSRKDEGFLEAPLERAIRVREGTN